MRVANHRRLSGPVEMLKFPASTLRSVAKSAYAIVSRSASPLLQMLNLDVFTGVGLQSAIHR